MAESVAVGELFLVALSFGAGALVACWWCRRQALATTSNIEGVGETTEFGVDSAPPSFGDRETARQAHWKVLGKGLGGLTHDLCNPLSYTLANLEMLAEDMLVDTQVTRRHPDWMEMLLESKQGTEAMGGLTTLLRRLARPLDRAQPWELQDALSALTTVASAALLGKISLDVKTETQGSCDVAPEIPIALLSMIFACEEELPPQRVARGTFANGQAARQLSIRVATKERGLLIECSRVADDQSWNDIDLEPVRALLRTSGCPLVVSGPTAYVEVPRLIPAERPATRAAPALY